MGTHALMARWLATLTIVGTGVAEFCTASSAGQPAGQGSSSSAAAAAETVDMFAAIEAGKLEAKLIPRDAKKARIFLENKTRTPLNVRLPATFAGVPVLAQFPGLGRGQGTGMQMQSPQTIGGPTNGNNNNNNRNIGNVFNIPAEKVGEIRVDCVCLEYGKPNPRPIMPYKLVPLASVASSQTVALLEEFGNGSYSQHVVQAAAWHLASNLSWEKLSGLPVQLVANGVYEPYFTKQDLSDAKALTAIAEKKAVPSSAANSTAATATGETPTVASAGR